MLPTRNQLVSSRPRETFLDITVITELIALGISIGSGEFPLLATK
jgi:hypothetical protein